MVIMELSSNAEKQARYRKKEQLKRNADNLLREWQSQPWNHGPRKLHDVRHLILKAIDLPSGWTDEDYQVAEIKLAHIHADLFLGVNHIANDIHDSSNFSANFRTTPDPSKLKKDFDESVERTTALASHIISALNLSSTSEGEQAAALMEALRFVGRSLVMSNEIPYSEATAMCLATVGPHFVRPDWFTQKLSEGLSKQLDRKLLTEISHNLVKQQ